MSDFITSVPGQPLQSLDNISANEAAVITFGYGSNSFEPKKRPLPPLVMSNYTSSGDLFVSVVLYLPISNGNSISFDVNIQKTNSNEVSFYVTSEISPEASTEFYPFGFSFGTAGTSFSGDYKSAGIDKVRVIAWDDDPEGSRGTTTTVKKPA